MGTKLSTHQEKVPFYGTVRIHCIFDAVITLSTFSSGSEYFSLPTFPFRKSQSAISPTIFPLQKSQDAMSPTKTKIKQSCES